MSLRVDGDDIELREEGLQYVRRFRIMNGYIFAHGLDGQLFRVMLSTDLLTQLAYVYEQGVDKGRKIGQEEKADEINRALGNHKT